MERIKWTSKRLVDPVFEGFSLFSWLSTTFTGRFVAAHDPYGPFSALFRLERACQASMKTQARLRELLERLRAGLQQDPGLQPYKIDEHHVKTTTRNPSKIPETSKEIG